MSDFVQFLALWAVTAGASIAIGASVRLAEQRARYARMCDEALTVITWGAVLYPLWGVVPRPLDQN